MTGAMMAKHQNGTSVLGLVLLLLILGLDGFTSTFQGRLVKDHQIWKDNQMPDINDHQGHLQGPGEQHHKSGR